MVTIFAAAIQDPRALNHPSGMRVNEGPSEMWRKEGPKLRSCPMGSTPPCGSEYRHSSAMHMIVFSIPGSRPKHPIYPTGGPFELRRTGA